MNHTFIPSQIDKEKCGICKYNFLQHSNLAECEAGECKNIGPVNPVKTILMCATCEEREINLTIEMNLPENVAARINDVQNAFTVSSNTNGNDKIKAISIEASRIIHNEISVREDIFNAKTQSIYSLDQELHADSSVSNPNYVLAENLMASLKMFQDVIFDANAAIIKAGNEQRATIVYINQLANKLRVEEREKLKIADINYKPLPPKLSKVGKTKTTKDSNGEDKPEKPKKKKYNLKQSELHMLMKATGMKGHIIALLNMKGMTPDDILKMHNTNMETVTKPTVSVIKEKVSTVSTVSNDTEEVVDMDELN